MKNYQIFYINRNKPNLEKNSRSNDLSTKDKLHESKDSPTINYKMRKLLKSLSRITFTDTKEATKSTTKSILHTLRSAIVIIKKLRNKEFNSSELSSKPSDQP